MDEASGSTGGGQPCSRFQQPGGGAAAAQRELSEEEAVAPQLREKLQRLREGGAIRGPEWLQGAVADIHRDELRAMAKAAGLPVRKSTCFQLWQQSIIAVNADKPMNILFHCFGGINRSAAVLCAWLIAAYGYSAEDAIKMLLTKTLRPWRHRDCVLEALWMVEQQRCEWHQDFRLGAA